MKKDRKRDGVKGFTLIELLIVVAIIAILAAIAVPNFLEAQVRSKVARVHADMRSVATAIESYATDWNNPPYGWREYNLATWNEVTGGLTIERYIANKKALSALTTPVSYMSSIPNDPFQEKYIKKYDQGYDSRVGPHPFNYDTYFGSGAKKKAIFLEAFKAGYTWSLTSPGPAAKDGPPQQILTGRVTNTKGGTRADASYDSTNGTVSAGVIIRTNKGIFEGSGAAQ